MRSYYTPKVERERLWRAALDTGAACSAAAAVAAFLRLLHPYTQLLQRRWVLQGTASCCSRCMRYAACHAWHVAACRNSTHILLALQAVVVGNVLDVAGKVRCLSTCTLHVLLQGLSGPPGSSSSSDVMWCVAIPCDSTAHQQQLPSHFHMLQLRINSNR